MEATDVQFKENEEQEMGEWLVSRDGQQFGPYADDDFRQYVAEEKILSTDLCWREGMNEWISVSSSAAPSLMAIIDGLNVSENKKALFRLIANARLVSAKGGFPVFDGSDARLKPFKTNFASDYIWSGWGCLFSWLYYLATGMFRKGLVILMISIFGSIVIRALIGQQGVYAFAIVLMVFCGAMANYDLYRKLALKETFWW